MRDTGSREVTENTSDCNTEGGLAAVAVAGDNSSHINPQAAPSIIGSLNNSANMNYIGLRKQ